MSTPEAPGHKPGDIVNGHRLTTQPGGSLEWLPIDSGPVKKKSRKGLWITLGVIGSLIVASSIAIAAYGGGGSPKADDIAIDKPASVEQVAEEPAAEPAKVVIPDVTGLTASVAIANLRAAGFETPDVDDPDATVTGTTPATGELAAEGSFVILIVEVKPELTLAQQNAVGQAQSYTQFQAFSRTGLIEQLEYEGYSTEDATFAVDYIAADWNAQAAAKAQSYLEYQSFSREGLYEQLIFEGFSDAEANAGLAAVGY